MTTRRNTINASPPHWLARRRSGLALLLALACAAGLRFLWAPLLTSPGLAPVAPQPVAAAVSMAAPLLSVPRTRTTPVPEGDADPTRDLGSYLARGENPREAQVIAQLHQRGIHAGLGAFSPPGTTPPLVGLAVPAGFVLPKGYVRHHQSTDDGQTIEAVLMFHPDHRIIDASKRPIAVPKNRVVPPELAPPGLPIRRIVIPAPIEPSHAALNAMHQSTRAVLHTGSAILASTLMAAVYVRGGHGWLLGFVMLVPWLHTLHASSTLGMALLRAYCMALAYTAAAFAWFGVALGQYAQIGGAAGLALLLLAAPLFQPQFLFYALMRHILVRRHGVVLGALAGAAAWTASEWLLPKLLGDTIGHGLYPSPLLRQGAAVGGAAGLTLLLLLTNEALAAALARRAMAWRCWAAPLALAALVPLLLAGYGVAVHFRAQQVTSPTLRIGLVQSNIVAYERQRQERGAYVVVRDILDIHFAMSYDAVERQRAGAVLWSETVYPTTFGQSKSDAGAQFDRDILGFVTAAGVPFVFGTYDRDPAGKYNAAAFVQPGTGLTGFYRKTNLFPLTEYVPAWLDGPLLRQRLPWLGHWRHGNGARVLPLRLKDGREIPVLPLICYDDLDTSLAIDGTRLGAQAILTMSNDAWFTADSLGAQLHQTVAAFRSIETGLPQFRVTTNGYSAVIDASGAVLASAGIGERTLVIADVPVPAPAGTLMVKWGNWVGMAASVFLAAWARGPYCAPGGHAALALPCRCRWHGLYRCTWFLLLPVLWPACCVRPRAGE